MNRPRILLADDHLLLLDGLRNLLERHYELVGTVQDGQAVVSAAQRLRPDLVLMDVAMPVLNGLQAGQRLREQQPKIKLLYVSMYGDPPYVEEAMRLGASGYVLKRSGWSELSRAIEAALAGKQYVSSELSGGREEPPVLPPVMAEAGRVLTERQRQILKLVAAGYTAREIGRMLHITSKTVEFHKNGLMNELGLRTTADLTRYALMNRIIAA